MKKIKIEDFINKSRKVHNDKYDYSKVKYINSYTHVCIICPEHGEFWQIPNSHKRGNGCPKCLYLRHKKTIFGVGVNDYREHIYIDGKVINSYSTWHSMIRRCYSKVYHKSKPTYIDCTVCDEWKYFSNFKKWFDNPKNGYKEGYCLDKDILVKGNKEYAPNKCCFVPNEINSLLLSCKSKRGELPIGVKKNGNKYQANARCYNYNKSKIVDKYLGLFENKEIAFNAYKKCKEKQIKDMAKEYYKKGKIGYNVYNSLLTYNIEIED